MKKRKKFWKRTITIITAIASVVAILGISLKDVFNVSMKAFNSEDKEYLRFSYKSNYFEKYLLNVNEKLFSVLEMENNSSKTFEDIQVKTYLFNKMDTTGECIFSQKIYYIDKINYIPINIKTENQLKGGELFKLNIAELIEDFMRENKMPRDFLFPYNSSTTSIEAGSNDSTVILNFPNLKDNPAFFEPFMDPYYYRRGFILKILVSYKKDNKEYMHLLHGGLFYFTSKKGKLFYRAPQVVDGFVKADFSFKREIVEDITRPLANFEPYILKMDISTNNEYNNERIGTWHAVCQSASNYRNQKKSRTVFILKNAR